METGEGEMLGVKSEAWNTVPRSDTLPDVRQGLEHDSNLDGLSSDRLEELSRTVTGSKSRSGKAKRSARASNNLRKSLAWDKAFSTDEGVLDIDELPLVTKTPRKPLEFLDIPAILGRISPGPHPASENHNPNARAVDRVETITSSPLLSSLHLESFSSGSPNSRTLETTPSKGISLVVAPSNPDTKTSKLDSKSSSSDTKIVKADALKGTRLRLPSSFTGKRGKSDMAPKPVSVPESNFLRRCKSSSSILSPSSASAAFSKKISSVSKKVKDTLGKVLPGSLAASAKQFKKKEDRTFHQGQAAKTPQTPMSHRHDAPEDDVKSTPASVANSKSSTKKDAKVEANNQQVIPTEQLGYGAVTPGSKGSSQASVAGTSSKKVSDNQSFYSTQVRPWLSRKKLGPESSQSPSVEHANHVNAAQNRKGASSGLRLPSPKIGFFETPRSASGEHHTSLPERRTGSALDTSNSKNARKGLPPRPKNGLPSGRVEKPGGHGSLAKVSTKTVSSGIPSAPHLRPFGKSAEGLVRSASTPASPHKNHHAIRSSASPQTVTGRRPSPQANSDLSHSGVPELRTRTLLNAASGAISNESRDCESGQSLNPLGTLEVDALSQVMANPSGRSSTGFKQDAEIGNLGGDKSPNKLANSSVDSTKLPTDLSLSGLLPPVTSENTPKNAPESCLRSASPASASDAQSSKHPLTVNAALLNGISKRTSQTASRKEKNMQLDFEQSASESTSGQENKRSLDVPLGGTHPHTPKQRKSNYSQRLDHSEAYGDLFSEERLLALEAEGQESLQKKSGAVQHSPPNKTSPNRNPWSPVKKGGQQPGPFDCTKKYTNACMGQ